VENTTCIICSSKNSVPYLTLNDRLNISHKNFYINKCECGFVYLNPRPNISEIYNYYQLTNYVPHLKIKKSIWFTIYQYCQKLTFRYKYKIIRKYEKKGRLLDIGGGNGKFAEFMHSKGWEVIIHDSIIDNNMSDLSIPHFTKLTDIDSALKFNVITLWHSLEHIHDIRELFYFLDKYLDDNGTILIAVPNLNAPERKYYKSNWAPYDAPRHLYHFTLQTLTKLCNQNGLDVIKKYSLFQDSPYNIMLSLSKYSFFEIIKAISLCLYTFLKTLLFGPKYSSSILIICKKS